MNKLTGIKQDRELKAEIKQLKEMTTELISRLNSETALEVPVQEQMVSIKLCGKEIAKGYLKTHES